MKIGTFEPYKGYTGTIEYEPEDDLLYGKLECDDLINYHGSNVMELHRQYMEAVNDYKNFQKELAKDKVIQSLEQLKIVNPIQKIVVRIDDVSLDCKIGDMKIDYGEDGEIVIYKNSIVFL